MSSYDGARDLFAGNEPRRRRMRWAGWPLMLLLAWLLFDLTADAALAAVVACAKFGWDDLRTALWLRRTDPQKARGKTCFWFYLALALWKIAVTASVLIFLFPIIIAVQAGANAPRANAPPPGFMAALLQAMLCFLLASMTTAIGAACALWRRVRIWVDGAVHAARREHLWPPSAVCRKNRADVLLATALIAGGLVLYMLFVIGLTVVTEAPRGAGRQLPEWLSIVLAIMMILPIILGAPLVLWLRDVLSKKVVAAVPWDCWPT